MTTGGTPASVGPRRETTAFLSAATAAREDASARSGLSAKVRER